MSIKDRLMTYAEVLEHEPMKKHTTFKIGGCVDYYICLLYTSDAADE